MSIPQQPFRMLSVWQPWADFLTADETVAAYVRRYNPELAAQLPKDVENRGFGTPWRGTLFVHASKRIDRDAMKRFGLDPAGFVVGAVVGTVRLVDVVTDSTSYWAETGKTHWSTADLVRLDSPVECRGFQGPRVPTTAVLVAVLARVERQRQRTTPVM